MEKQHHCENCPIRTKYDQSPRSFIGRFWRWHINFCPGWKKYFTSLDENTKNQLRTRYSLTK